MPLFKRSIGETIKAARQAIAGHDAARTIEVAAMIVLITRLADQISPRDLREGGEAVHAAMDGLSASAGFARLKQVARDRVFDLALGELHIDGDGSAS